MRIEKKEVKLLFTDNMIFYLKDPHIYSQGNQYNKMKEKKKWLLE